MDKKIGLGMFFCFFLLGIWLSPWISVSWDEPDNIWASGVYINFFRSGFNPDILVDKNASASYFHQKIFTQEPSLYRYPSFPLYIGAIVVLIGENIIGELTPQHIFTAFHIASAMFWGIFGVALYYFVRLFTFSRLIAVITSIVIAFHPTIFGYGLSIIKDSAQVSLFTLSLLLLIKSVESNRRSLLFISTLVWGAAMATKINAIYVPVIWGTWRMFLLISECWKTKKLDLKTILSFVKDLCIFLCGGIITMILLWPYLWFDPITRIREVITYFTSVGTGYKVFWNGNMYVAGIGNPIPWYPILHFAVGTPIPILFFSFVGFITAVYQLLMRTGAHSSWTILLVLWAVIPLFRTLSGNAAFYDGIRHFLEIIPPIILFSAWGLEYVTKFVGRWIGDARHSLLLVVLALVTYLVMLHVHFFPYSSGYVNAFISDPNTTVERDFAALSIAEAIAIGHVYRPQGSKIFVPIGGHLSWYYLTGGDTYVYTVADSDMLILINKSSHIIKRHFDAEVYSMFEFKQAVMRGNDIFAWIYVKRI